MDIFLKTISAVNDATRVNILAFIKENSSVCVCDVENSFEMIQSRISRHLKILKDAGFLKVERKGKWAYYSIRTPLDIFRQNILKEITSLELDLPKLNNGCKMEEKKVLVMCTGNSCRSIIGEALINAKIDGVKAYSCGVAPSGRVNPNAKKVLQDNGIWDDAYHSKHLDALSDIEFDLVVTVCDHAKESCPMFPKKVKTIHVGFEDPDGKEFDAFVDTYKEIEKVLLKEVQDALSR